jgi:hypothetical protein
MMGDLDHIRRMADEVFRKALITEEETWEELRKDGKLDREAVRSGKIPPEVLVYNKYWGRLSSAKEICAILAALGIEIPVPDFDFSLINTYFGKAQAADRRNKLRYRR